MSEYDYSPDAHRRHMEKQASIARWVDTTSRNAKDFRNPLAPSPADASRSPSPDDVLPSHSISQFNPSPPAHSHGHHHHSHGHHRTPPQPYPAAYAMYPQQPTQYMAQPLPGPTPYAVLDRSGGRRSHSSSRHSHSSSRRSSKKSRSPTYIVSPTLPGPMPYGGGPASMIMSPPVSPGVPGAPAPYMIYPQRGQRVQVLSAPNSPGIPTAVPQYTTPLSAGANVSGFPFPPQAFGTANQPIYPPTQYANAAYPNLQPYPAPPQIISPPPMSPPGVAPSAYPPVPYQPVAAGYLYPGYGGGSGAGSPGGNKLKKRSGTKGYSYVPADEWRRSW
ncbi:hypothetical protein HGRIS_000760 [Hohenbuehelia grisea]|uniref:Uncharacterized protein n=1 Tax=Hohenbuehelia grisea TaxID=104357 RepID=A0ABR3IPN4_9AGAR